jgi:Ni/Co efflux regulator RcnB
MPRKLLPLLIAVATLLAAFALPVSAGLIADRGEDAPIRDTHRQRRDVPARPDRVRDIPDVDAVVELSCGPRVTDDAAAVKCEWRAGDDLQVRAWQLWNLQVRPEKGTRNLVAELGADVVSYTDTEVSVPAAYLYAVLGLDGNGEIIARSRLQSVTLGERDREIEQLRLECAAHRVETDGRSDARPEFAVGCGWSEVGNTAAVGYVMWKSVDGGERTVLARVGLDVTELRDAAVAPGHRYTYVVTAVDADGEIVGRSRAVHVGIRNEDRPTDREIDRPVDREIDREIDRPVDRETDRPVDREIDREIDRPVDRETDRPVDREIDRETDRPAGRD